MKRLLSCIIILSMAAVMLNFSITPSSAKDDNILIAYFDRTENSLEDTDATTSASKVSEASPAVMAQMIKNQTGGDVFSIVVSDKYPSDYDECLSRAQQENDANARPALNTTVQNMNSYDTIFLGFPDWCGTCPMAIFTFLESYDFAGKTIIPFCAHGTSGFGTSISDIKNVCPNSIFEQEFGVYRDSGASCEAELQAWLSELGYDKEPEMTLTNDMVTIHTTEPIDSASLILAGYAAGTLMNVNIRKVSTDSNLEIKETVSGFDDADMVKAYLWDGIDTLKPLCTSKEINVTQNTEQPKSLIVYFSRVGNTDYPDDVDATTSASVVVNNGGNLTGTTETIAKMINTAVDGDIAEIQTISKYSTDFEEVVDRNHNEISEGTIPEIQPLNLDMSKYDTVFIGYPIWATTIPQAVRAFMREYDLSGKTVIPFCTHDGYGSGNSYTQIKNECSDSTVLDGLTLPAADIVGKDLTSVNNRVKDWLTGLGIDVGGKEMDGTPIKITIGSRTLEGYLNNTPEAEQFKAMLPITVSMVGYGGREYYGGISGTINDSTEGKLNFENGDITYCPTNNTVAIFYAQTSRPNLTMRVISMGMVTSDLSVFDELGGNEDITFSLAE